MPSGSSPFATFLIVGPTCFFLGVLFSLFPYDYYVLWAIPPGLTASDVHREPYYARLEEHLRFLHASPPLISRVFHTVMGCGIIGLLTKLYKPSEANMLFDGASLVLYVCGIAVYIANTVRGLRIVTDGTYGAGVDPTQEAEVAKAAAGGIGAGEIIGREDSLKVLAASNTIMALLLVGVLILQAGQWYALKKEAHEIEEMDKAAAEKQKQRESGTRHTQEKDKKRQ